MSQDQPRRPPEDGEPIKYGDIFPVSGDLATKPVAPRDAASMQAAENIVTGHTQKGGPAAVMQSAATKNEQAGLVGHDQAVAVTGNEGIVISESEVADRRIVTEAVAGQVLGQYVQAISPSVTQGTPITSLDPGGITIGEALEATTMSAGDKPIDQSDAAAIQAAEVRATGVNVITTGGVAAQAQSAAVANAHTMRDKDKTTLSDVLSDATAKLPADKAATREDAENVIGAEIRNKPDLTTHPGGVAASVAAAARLNQNV
ncbi:Late embryogenesis abundant protein, SMP subgroup domain [Dillenia turbinata]|uniref:Late embryogenesis abundant protein, SMP subgroup domain n=1 Tax=Dillenia turbinata TaxID=194707 RepID=A0AAN8W3P5_9MAGN